MRRRQVASQLLFATLLLTITGCSGMPEGAEPLRPGDIRNGSSTSAEKGGADEASTKTEGSAASNDDLVAQYNSLKCPSLEAPPEDLTTPEEIREWGCQKLVGDLDQPAKLGTKHLGDKMFPCAVSQGSKMQYYCWGADGEELARFGDLRDSGFQQVRISKEVASNFTEGATLLSRDSDTCMGSFERGKSEHLVTVKEGAVDDATFFIRDDQGRLLEEKKYSGSDSGLRTVKRLNWDGMTFEEFEVTDGGEKPVATGKADDEGRIVRRVSTETKAVMEYAFDEEGRQVLYRYDSDGDGKWETVERKTFDGQGRTVSVEKSVGPGKIGTTVYEFGPHGIERGVLSLDGDEHVVQKVTYDSKGRPVTMRKIWWPGAMMTATHKWNDDNRAKTEQADYRLAPGATPDIKAQPEGDARKQSLDRWYGCYFE